MTEFISRKYGNDGYEVIIKTDSHEHYTASEEFARRLIGHAKPMTNADWIRSMTDEELAEFIRDVSHECQDAYSGVCFRCKFPWCSSNDTEKWLQQPAEEKE